jgi:hypothetical protein
VAVSKLARHVSNPGLVHVQAVKRVMQYLAATRELALVYKRSGAEQLRLHAYADSSYGDEDCAQRKSTTGYLIYLGMNLVCWATYRQKTVARSSTEAELISASDCVLEILWARKLMSDLGERGDYAVELRGDNTTAVSNAAAGDYKRTKYIDVRYQHVHERVKENVIAMVPIPGAENTADAQTKALQGELFRKHRKGMCVE